MATIIYSNMGDEDCKCLQKIWEGIDGVKVVEIRYSTDITREEIDKAISEETDLLICCGHGSSSGLFGFNKNLSGYAFGEKQIDLVKAKNFFGMWCHASDFAKYNGMVGFFTSMFISNPGEAYCNGIKGTTQEYVNEATIRFCNKVNELIRSGKDVEQWRDELMPVMDENNPVDVFNYNGLYMSHGEIFERPKYDFPRYAGEFGENNFIDPYFDCGEVDFPEDFYGNYTDEDILLFCDDYLNDVEKFKEEYDHKCKVKVENILLLHNKKVSFRVGERPYAVIKNPEMCGIKNVDSTKSIEIEKVWIDGVCGDIFFKLLDFEEPFLYDDVEINAYDLILNIAISINHIINKD